MIQQGQAEAFEKRLLGRSVVALPQDALAAATMAASSALAGDLAVAHASLQAKHKDTLLTLSRLQNSKATISYQIDNLKDR